MESTRIQKIQRQIQKDLSEIFREDTAKMRGVIVSVSNVRVRYGAQFFHTWGKHSVVAGMIMEHKMRLHSDYILIETQTADSIHI